MTFKIFYRVVGTLVIVIALSSTVDGFLHAHYLRAALSIIVGLVIGSRFLLFGPWGVRPSTPREGTETRRCPLCGREVEVPHVGGHHLGVTYIAPTPQEIEAACVAQHGAHPMPPTWSPPYNRSHKISVSCAASTEAEQNTRRALLGILARYDTSPWVFTDHVVIDHRAVPHSHPVLTLNTFNGGFFLLASYVHEQLHWYAEAHATSVLACQEFARSRYPDAPVGLPEGAHDEFSTYLHIVVCWLEIDALRRLLGEYASELLERMAERGVYRWIYRTVLRDFDELQLAYAERGLQPVAPARSR